MVAIEKRFSPFPSLVFLASLLFLMAGCATSSEPHWRLSTADMLDSVAFGGWARAWIDTQKVSSKIAPAVQGELVAVHADSIFILSDDTFLHSVPVPSIRELRLTAYNAEATPLNTWYGVGVLLAPAHGIFLIFELPLWFVVGGTATLLAPDVSEFKWPDQKWEVIRRYARFPQGLPTGLDRSLLLPSPARWK